jgi:creatinine amidohydrolase
MSLHKYLYGELTWLEIKEAVAAKKVVILPFGAVEDHGHHSPLDTDNIIGTTVCLEAGRRAPEAMLILPTIPYGLDEHHMDFPGTITIEMTTLINFVADVCISVARAGFTHILIVNSHGSNVSIADLAARKCVLQTGVICAALTSLTNVSLDAIAKHRQSGPGGISHACEYETSLLLHLRPDLIDMSKAVNESGLPKLKYFNWDWPEPSAYAWQDWWTRFSVTGTYGDATIATKEFGEILFEDHVTNLIELVREFKTIPIKPRVDHH